MLEDSDPCGRLSLDSGFDFVNHQHSQVSEQLGGVLHDSNTSLCYIVHKRHLRYFNRTGTTQPLRADVRSVWYLAGTLGHKIFNKKPK